MNLISKLCVLFVAWAMFGGISIATVCAIWCVRLEKIDHPNLKELNAELLNGISHGAFNYKEDDTLKDTAQKVEKVSKEPIVTMLLEAFIEWPKYLPLAKMLLDEAYDYAVNKYGLKSEKSAS